MTEPTLQHLVTEATHLGGAVHPCKAWGHDWRMNGGRQCPRNQHARCSQAVYECARCGDCDYGDPGGPGHRDCMIDGPCDRSCAPLARPLAEE
jgi:hypothetical protein